MNVLVVGGAGYIGSHMVWALHQAGHRVVTFDNLSSGHRDAVLAGDVVLGDLADRVALERLFAHQRFDAVLHFASSIQVGESVREPLRYYQNNVANTLNLLEVMVRHRVLRLIFSSTAAIFGHPQTPLIAESHPQHPINPYGRSKWMVEQMLADADLAHGLRSVSLRYFNAAGADALGRIGERHEPETHLIPLVLQAASGRRTHIAVNGTDYDTADGTCVRDYIHVEDLAQAHLLALNQLCHADRSEAFNLGNGSGYSVAQVIASAQRVTGCPIDVTHGPRREGDPAVLVADSQRARDVLGWKPAYADLDTIVAHAWQWERQSLQS